MTTRPKTIGQRFAAEVADTGASSPPTADAEQDSPERLLGDSLAKEADATAKTEERPCR